MAIIEDKFIVIAIKDIKENLYNKDTRHATVDLLDAVEKYVSKLSNVEGKGLDKEFYVCNTDEEYAEEVIDIILKGEDKKQGK